MNPPRRWLFKAASVAALFATFPATAQPYPSRPVIMIVAASAGGPTNAIARGMSDRITADLGGTVLVDNVAGAGGSIGVGSPPHISGIFFQKLTDTRFAFVPYRGTAAAMRDLLAGQIDIMIDQASSLLRQLRAGSIKAYSVTARERLASAPEVPTVDEVGLPGLHVSVSHGLWAPRGTSPDIVAQLNAAVVKSLAEPATKEKLAALGQDIPPADQLRPRALGAWQKAEIEKWWPIVKAAGIKAE